MTINDEWNLATGKFRDERLIRERNESLKYVQERLALKDERERERNEKAEKLVRLEKVKFVIDNKFFKKNFVNLIFYYAGTFQIVYHQRKIRRSN